MINGVMLGRCFSKFRNGQLSRFTARLSSGSPETFVSEHFEVNPLDLEAVVADMKTEYRRNGDRLELKHCRLCKKGNVDKPDNLWKLYLNKNGSYRCFRCGVGGSWFQLKELVGLSSSPIHSFASPRAFEGDGATVMKPIPDQEKSFLLTKTLFSGSLPYVDAVMNYLVDERKLSQKVLQRYGVGCSLQQFMNDHGIYEEEPCITFPWLVERSLLTQPVTAENGLPSDIDTAAVDVDCIPHFVIERVKYRALSGKGKQRVLPKGGSWGFFGWHLVKSTDTTIILTEGEFDAMAVAQVLSELPSDHEFFNVPVVSLPNGCNSFPPELLQRLERFNKIYIWMDNDSSGVAGAKKFAAKIGLNRAYLVNPPLDASISLDANSKYPKDANDALRAGCDLVEFLKRAYRPRHDKILTFADLRNEALLTYGNDPTRDGTTTPSVPRLTRLLKGFRRGELVLVTGPTGCGKTTLLSQLSIDFTRAGAKTLWGSFEIKNHLLARKMLRQFYKGEGLFEDLPVQLQNKIADEFSTLPMMFMNFHSGTELEAVLGAMEFAVYREDVDHIILDNLQFMMPREHRLRPSGGEFSKFAIQDHAIDKFRAFATEKNVNIILVIHPKKDDDKNALGISSIFGTAKATQEADAILIIQRDEKRTYLDIKKNRYDGELGKINLAFSPVTSCFFETST